MAEGVPVTVFMVSSDTYAPAPEVLMGLYSTRKRAETARDRFARARPHEGFQVDEVEVDEDYRRV
jgi:hypothetical protein